VEKTTYKTETLTEFIEGTADSPNVRESYSKAQRLGITLEKWLFAVLSMFYPKSRGYTVTHVDWNNYTKHMGRSVDLRLFLRSQLLAVFECKNWRLLPKHRYGLKDAKEQVLSRFHNCGTNIKIVTISFKEQLSRKALKFLEANKILILETGKIIGKKDFKSKLIYSFGKQIIQLISNFKSNQRAKQKPLFFNKLNSLPLTKPNIATKSNLTNLSCNNITVVNVRKLNDSDLLKMQFEMWLNSANSSSKQPVVNLVKAVLGG